jgi:sulfite reductase alpha subunit-like flavoprotein
MAHAAIVYCSDTWTTAGLADDIASELRERGIETLVAAIGEVDPGLIASADYVFLGCWTHGWFVVNQHPVQAWVEWARGLPRLEHARVALFTTYKVRTGSMFPRMRRELRRVAPVVELELKAKGTHLTPEGRVALDRFLDRGLAGRDRAPTETIA